MNAPHIAQIIAGCCSCVHHASMYSSKCTVITCKPARQCRTYELMQAHSSLQHAGSRNCVRHMQVHLLVRGDKLRASKTMQERALTSPKIKVHFNTSVEDAVGNGVLTGLNLVNNKTGGWSGCTACMRHSIKQPGEKGHLGVAGLFYGIGHQPNNKLIQGQVELDEKGYVKLKLTDEPQVQCNHVLVKPGAWLLFRPAACFSSHHA
eukprot:scaffold54626_cov17-Tisochrysis_lutea.AAC.1